MEAEDRRARIPGKAQKRMSSGLFTMLERQRRVPCIKSFEERGKIKYPGAYRYRPVSTIIMFIHSGVRLASS
jgi:hypothetical protein